MRKILYISTRDPFSGRYSGDVIRSLKIINTLKKKYNVDIVYLGEKKLNNGNNNIVSFIRPNIFLKFFYCLISLIKIQPIQFGLFFSKNMKDYIQDASNNYEIIFFQHIRASQYLPENFYGTTILDMGDLYSENYKQTYKYLSFLNPMKYIYFLESIFVKRVENKIFSIFDKVLLFSKNEVKKVQGKFNQKILKVDESIEKIHKKISYSPKKNKILFVGNLNYLPNILACRDFIKNILPQLNKLMPEIRFCIIGNIKNRDKILLSRNKNVEIIGSKKEIIKYVKNSFCGLANLYIATGVQVKVLKYMSYGLPVICSNLVAANFDNNVLNFNSNHDLVKKISDLKNKKIIWEKFSRKSYSFVKKYKWKKIQIQYFKMLIND